MHSSFNCKYFHRLLRNIGKLSDNQCSVSVQETSNNKFIFTLQVLPNDGLYRDGQFDFVIKLCHRFPIVAPDIKCLTPIFHPNIDDMGEICLSLLDEWTCDNTLEDCVQGILFLFYNPNLEDPLSPYFCPEDAEDVELFYKNVRKSLEGGIVEGFKFNRNLVVKDVIVELNNDSFDKVKTNDICIKQELHNLHTTDKNEQHVISETYFTGKIETLVMD